MVTPRRFYEILDLNLAERSYPIVFGYDDDAVWLRHLERLVGGRKVAVITDSNVEALYRARLESCLANCEVAGESWFVVCPGEGAKTRERLWELYDGLLASQFGRDGLICALGGGVVGDLAGFLAATVHRGVELVHLPTSLLAMVDSSIGGKTGINHPLGKNLIGAFHQPRAVLANLSVLGSLPKREIASGLAEVIKYGAAFDQQLFRFLEEHLELDFSFPSEQVLEIVVKSARIKTGVVQRDELESGERAKLNFGHTIGHAIERTAGFGEWSHGAAVAVGMVEITRFGEMQGFTPPDSSERIRNLCEHHGLPTSLESKLRRAVSEAIAFDKKVRGNEVSLVLPSALGESRVRNTRINTLVEWLIMSQE